MSWHGFRLLMTEALAESQEFYDMYETCWRLNGHPGFRRYGLHGRAKAVVTFDRVMAGNVR